MVYSRAAQQKRKGKLYMKQKTYTLHKMQTQTYITDSGYDAFRKQVEM